MAARVARAAVAMALLSLGAGACTLIFGDYEVRGTGGAAASSSSAASGGSGGGTATSSSSAGSGGSSNCMNGSKDGDETDVDCGGAGCLPCGNGLGCKVDGDCVNGSCAGGVCCETDCSGPCRSCNKEDTGLPNGLCAPVPAGKDPGGICESTVGGRCSIIGMCACGNQVKDGQETGTDCGGDECKNRCANGEACNAAGDCTSNVCYSGGGGKVCCEQSCSGDCKSCNLVIGSRSWAGQCVDVPYGDLGGCPNGLGLGCNSFQLCVPGKVNGMSCSSDGDCISGKCAGNGKCRPDGEAAGVPCTISAWCASANCDDTTFLCH
ncbi:MAG: hypothetical protein QM820_37795 [Minicystis sp.]